MQIAEIRNDSELTTKANSKPNCVDAGAAEKGADRERGPLRGLGQRVGGVQFLAGGDGGQDRRAPAGEERRGEHQQRAQQVEQPGVGAVDGEDEAGGDHARGSGRSRS